jgi:hypothetical protein
MQQDHEDPAPYNAFWQQEAAKETYASTQFLILSPYSYHYYTKNGGMIRTVPCHYPAA